MKERIIKEARHLFSQYGVKTVRLDDIAQQLGISKKTVYQYFTDKEELVRLMLEEQLNETLAEASSIHEQAPNPVAGALQIWDRLVRYRRTINPNLFRDIERHYPTVWHFFEEFRARYLNVILVTNLRQGVAQGLYRTDLDELIIAWLWAEQSQWEVPDERYKTQMKHHFMRGLLTTEGLALYELLMM
ncbi:TetR/AcrR family transcriptional regulator [Spirosoma soli]|uniref:TetR/AcrR family transcriptional regulator n=1 Tax=Spirosoma soli TaxID=1770529 RepID=A0ABW5M580_9BACT